MERIFGPQKTNGKRNSAYVIPSCPSVHPMQNYLSRRDSDIWVEAADTQSQGAPCFTGDSRDGALTLSRCFLGLVLEKVPTASPREGLLDRILPGEQSQRDKGKEMAWLKCLKGEHPCSQAAETKNCTGDALRYLIALQIQPSPSLLGWQGYKESPTG